MVVQYNSTRRSRCFIMHRFCSKCDFGQLSSNPIRARARFLIQRIPLKGIRCVCHVYLAGPQTVTRSQQSKCKVPDKVKCGPCACCVCRTRQKTRNYFGKPRGEGDVKLTMNGASCEFTVKTGIQVKRNWSETCMFRISKNMGTFRHSTWILWSLVKKQKPVNLVTCEKRSRFSF